ncbi:MAG: SusC/RagA family TonB-linked outer membrane protein [Cytophagales bacterium]|nr:SusC/RagA family TonB-linked outer membrane protein [Cytophagales bacterium]
MKKKYYKFKKYALFAMLLYTAFYGYSQTTESTLKGKLIDETTQAPLVGATVYIKGTKIAVQTDENGAFELKTVKEFPFTLSVNYVGYQNKEIEIYEEDQNIEFKVRSRLALNEVVVTAIGLESERKSITYSLTEIKGKDIIQAREPNITTALSGKIAGVQVQNSGGSPGGSSDVRIRGNTSVLASNAPLYVLDGVPIDNSIQDILPISNSLSLATPSNRAIDINQDDIETMTVLKGPAAAALYGIRASNGAIVITTKRGSSVTNKKLTINLNTSLSVEEPNRRFQPRQTKFSNGINGNYVAPGLAGSDENWGASLDTLTYSNTPSSFYKGGQIVGKSNPNSNGVPIESFDNLKNFFVNGITQNHNISVASKVDKAGYYLSAGKLYQTGIVPTTDFYRNTFRFNGDYDVTDKLKVQAGVNFINSGANNRALMGGFNTNVLRALYNSPPNFDITNGLSDPANNPDSYLLPPTASRPWGDSRSYANGIGWDSPYWSLNQNPQKDNVDRWIGFAQTDYKILPWLTATFRAGLDNYRDIRKGGFGRGTSGVAAGVVNDINYVRKDINTDFILQANKDLSPDFNLNVIVGHNYYDSYRYQSNVRGDGLVVNRLYSVNNASTVQAFDQTINRRLVAVYGNAQIGYRKYAFLNITGRNEWSSTLPVGSNSFFYPSIGGTFVFSEAFKLENNWFSSGKIRGTFAQVGKDASPYALETYYSNLSSGGWIQSSVQGPFNGQSTLNYGSNGTNTLGNLKLKPETVTTYEIGGEVKFFKNRLGIDAVYYEIHSKDQIIPVAIPASSGSSNIVSNTGEVSNKGIELAVTATPVQIKDFSWDVTGIYYANRSKVEALAPGLNNIALEGAFVNSSAVVGQPFGVLYGVDYKRNDAGKYLIDDNKFLADGTTPNSNYGYYIVDPSPKALADPNPLFNASLRNALTYKWITLSFLLDTRYGFAIHNAPKLQAIFNGVAKETEDRGTTGVLDGVRASDGATNDIEVVKSQAFYRGTFGVPGYAVERDLHWLKLRDISLTFALPSNWLSPLKISNASLTLSARNIILSTNYTGSDPDLGTRTGLSNGLGNDFWTTPNTKSYGAALNVTF